MVTGILKKFLETAAVVAVGTSVLLVASNAQAAHSRPLAITEASWDGSTLTIRGTGERNVIVEAWNAADVSPTGFLGDDTPGNSGRYTITNSTAYAATVCRVHVEQDDGVELAIVEADVTGNPACDVQNDPPVCTIDTPTGDVTINAGETVDYTGTATDADGIIEAWNWTFEGGTPSSATVEDPGTVTYNTPGTYNTTFDATDNNGANCSRPRPGRSRS